MKPLSFVRSLVLVGRAALVIKPESFVMSLVLVGMAGLFLINASDEVSATSQSD